ncbi:hypothetical protein DY000_02050363 [Brassica cretica]|uniref:Translocase of chloroplast 159/132 membrane anchor domain-containing protein n=1 Tax=Brassica cretica TaxID=69181 RepID=A0ABQ7EYI8_BRACR|nr:hypothetical protein DY000_02050363 [Brassica cretica]
MAKRPTRSSSPPKRLRPTSCFHRTMLKPKTDIHRPWKALISSSTFPVRNMEEQKLAADRVIDDQVEKIELVVSDVDSSHSEDEVFDEAIDDGLHEDLPSEEAKDPDVNGESHGEANLQHITTGEAVPGFVTSQMNGDEGEAGSENVNETSTLSFSENGTVFLEKKQLVAEVIEETTNDGIEEENKEETVDVSGAQRNGERASGESSFNDSIQVASAGTPSPSEKSSSEENGETEGRISREHDTVQNGGLGVEHTSQPNKEFEKQQGNRVNISPEIKESPHLERKSEVASSVSPTESISPARPAGLGRDAPLLEPTPRVPHQPRVNGNASQNQSEQAEDPTTAETDEHDETRLSVMDWHGDLAIGGNIQSQVPIGRSSNLIARANLNNRGTGQVSVRVNSSEQLQLAMVAFVPLFKKLLSYYSPQQMEY